MKNGCFFPKSSGCAWEIAWPLFCGSLEGAVGSSRLQCSKQSCAMIKELTFGDTGMQRDIWNIETHSHPEAEILSFQLVSGKAFTLGSQQVASQLYVSPRDAAAAVGAVTFG